MNSFCSRTATVLSTFYIQGRGRIVTLEWAESEAPPDEPFCLRPSSRMRSTKGIFQIKQFSVVRVMSKNGICPPKGQEYEIALYFALNPSEVPCGIHEQVVILPPHSSTPLEGSRLG